MTEHGRRPGAAHIPCRSIPCRSTVVSRFPFATSAWRSRLPSASRNAVSRGAVQASGLTCRARGSSTPSHGLTPIFLGTAAFMAARNGANIRPIRAGDSGLVAADK